MRRWGMMILAATMAGVFGACTGGQEGTAAEEKAPERNPIAAQAPTPEQVNARREIRSISPSIPIYADAQYRPDLTRRDSVMTRNQYGPGAQVYTLATNDSFPQVYHYYMTYLAQFRAFPVANPYPAEQQNWRSLEIQLNQAMQDPFIPGDTIPPNGKQVLLQVSETEAEPKTVIRYVITPGPPPVTAAATPVTTSGAP